MFKALFNGRRLWMTLLVIVGALVLGRLGIWQLDRLAQRHAINASINTRMAQPSAPLNGVAIDPDVPDTLEYRRVEARGVYDQAQEILLRNRALDGVPGVHILTPLRLSGSAAAVLVDRGWVPLDQSAPDQRRTFAAPPGEVVVEGIARRSEDEGSPQDPPLGHDRTRLDAWFHVDTPRIQQQTGYPLLPLFIEQQPTSGDATLPHRVATTDLGEGPHLSYAIQWFAFALILLAGYIAFVYQRARREASSARQGDETR